MYVYFIRMAFVWDSKKSKSNQLKHGISFDDAFKVFDDFHITAIDHRKDYGEPRYCTMGFLGNTKRIVLVAHTQRNGKIRIISMRKANKREQKIFNNHLNEVKHE